MWLSSVQSRVAQMLGFEAGHIFGWGDQANVYVKSFEREGVAVEGFVIRLSGLPDDVEATAKIVARRIGQEMALAVLRVRRGEGI